ncbi:MAG: SUMF1/EgtB/PvdO family nonheme iron enzyme, partial [Planctomycetota bacterium]|nr:SUMF1/EgtB/PvdO family nonheme iron enzyme [Planctomycetota bacterium]
MPASASHDLTGDPLLAKAPRMVHHGVQRPALGGFPLLSKIGQGGMAAVYYGQDPMTGLGVAVKVLPLDLVSRSPNLAARFVREAQIAAQIRSENLIYVSHVDQDGPYFYQVMEYVRGISAGTYLELAQKSGRAGLPETEALEICIAAAKGLAAAHAQNIIHRDIKPDNILIPTVGETRKLLFAAAKLADLGLARTEHVEGATEVYVPQAPGREGPSLTGAGAAMGTLGYMPPEQIDDAKSVGKPADAFALGATLYALLAGHAPFEGKTSMERTLETAMGRRKPLAQERPDVSSATAAFVERCLRKEPEQRYADGTAAVAALEECLASLRKPAVAGVPQRVGARWPHARILLVPGAAVLLAMAGVGLWQAQRVPHRQEAENAPIQADEKAAPAGKTLAFSDALSLAREARKAEDWAQVVALLEKAPQAPAEGPERVEGEALLKDARAELKKRSDSAAKLKEAEALAGGGNFEAAKKAYAEAIALWPGSPDAKLAEDGVRHAEEGLSDQRYQQAMAAGDKALADDRWSDAATHFRAALSEQPDDGPARDALAMAEERAGAGGAAVPATQPESSKPVPETQPWALHDGQEAIADYAKRVNLPPTLSLDLGGGVVLHLVLLPAGRFTMGSPDAEKGRGRDETQHEVTITQPFYIGECEVTQEQYKAVIGKGRSRLTGPKNPMEQVSWDDAQEFCRKLNAKVPLALPASAGEGKWTVRLPTEAQWEYACRAGTKTPYCSGDDIEALKKTGWCSFDAKWQKAEGAKPVGSFKANGWGLHDMHGNVCEWCLDWYEDYAAGPATDPEGAVTGQARVARGGSWNGSPKDCRSASRFRYSPANCGDGLGLRVAVAVPASPRPPAPVAKAGAEPAHPVAPGASPRPQPGGPAVRDQAWGFATALPKGFTVAQHERVKEGGEFWHLSGEQRGPLTDALFVMKVDGADDKGTLKG